MFYEETYKMFQGWFFFLFSINIGINHVGITFFMTVIVDCLFPLISFLFKSLFLHLGEIVLLLIYVQPCRE